MRNPGGLLNSSIGKLWTHNRGESLTEAALTIGVVLLLAGAMVAFVDWSRVTDSIGNAISRAVSAPFGGHSTSTGRD